MEVHIYLNVNIESATNVKDALKKFNVSFHLLSDSISKTVSSKVSQRQAKSSKPSRVYDLSKIIIANVDDAVVDEFLALVQSFNTVDAAFVVPIPTPLYAPNDPLGLEYALTRQNLTHPSARSAFDVAMGEGIIIGILESSINGAPYDSSELGGTGDRSKDWEAILNDTHLTFKLFTLVDGTPVDPYGYGHGGMTCENAISVIDNGIGYCGAAPHAKVMLALSDYFSDAIIRMADLGCDIISVSYGGAYLHRPAIQYAVSQGTVVVYSHIANSHAEYTYILPIESLLIGVFGYDDECVQSYGIGLSCLSQGVAQLWESSATPVVAGIVGLIRQVHPEYNVWDVHAALLQMASKTPEMGGAVWTKLTGYGIPDPMAAFATNLDMLRPICPVDFAGKQNENFLTFSWTILPTSTFERVNLIGNREHAPQSVNDGQIFYQGTGSSFSFSPSELGHWFFTLIAESSTDLYSDVLPYTVVEIDVIKEEPPPEPPEWPPEIPLPIETMVIDWEFGGSWLDVKKWEKSSGYFSDRVSDACSLYLKTGYSLDIVSDENGCNVALFGELVDIIYLVDFVSKIRRAFELYLSGDYGLPGNFEYRFGV